jgi:hypothetical protein
MNILDTTILDPTPIRERFNPPPESHPNANRILFARDAAAAALRCTPPNPS